MKVFGVCYRLKVGFLVLSAKQPEESIYSSKTIRTRMESMVLNHIGTTKKKKGNSGLVRLRYA